MMCSGWSLNMEERTKGNGLSTFGTPLKINVEHFIMEVWRIMFLSKWAICRFQPLIFQGVYLDITTQSLNTKVRLISIKDLANKCRHPYIERGTHATPMLPYSPAIVFHLFFLTNVFKNLSVPEAVKILTIGMLGCPMTK